MSLPSSFIIVGSGVFGLSTAYALSLHPQFAATKITLIDRWDFEPHTPTISLHNPTSSNADTTRVIRRDYPHGPYASLAAEAMTHWRGKFGADQRYVHQRLLFSGEGSSLSIPELKKGETVNYIKKAYEISCTMTSGGKDVIQVVDSLDEIRGLLGNTPTRPVHFPETVDAHAIGLRGYISEDCGWADAGRSIEWLRQEVRRLGKVEFVVGQVEELVYSEDKAEVKGVRLGDGRELTADVTVVAAGARSSQLLNVPKLCDVYSEFVAYIQLTDAEADELRRRNWPILVNCHRGVFAVGPDHENCLKFGHFSYSGIADVLKEAGIDVPTRPDGWEAQQKYWSDPRFGFGGDVQFTPLGDLDDYERAAAQRALADYRLFLLELLGPTGFQGVDAPSLGGSDILLNHIANRPFTRVRKCWYNDTPALDFVVDYHPRYGKSLFVATGGCDHAFKFLPIIGEKVVALLLRNRGHAGGLLPEGVEPSLEELAKLWRFPLELLREQESLERAKL
ncbi:FAD dependent oxidoreductase [Aspergillus caelatus]|uniref:FAD dependent oxidoreductase n=1 Tax=Aspergillus caelatus TaxID=61420 RepID=A0A5N7A2T3_9EURO|nr:FAD dependent oxidoreductase [Aspergillus caelatus]KAE8363738.1 FAD dependent oxidoreductase [Aspergillus caelatus]